MVGAETLQNLWRENILDDVNNAHTRIDEHLEQSDEWLSDFEQRTLTHAKLAMGMYHTVMELKGIVSEQQRQIEELQAIVNYCHNRHPSEVIALRAFG